MATHPTVVMRHDQELTRQPCHRLTLVLHQLHFRWLHHALRLADNLTISTSTDYYTQSNHYQTHHSDYASTTYDQTITTRNQAGHETKHTIKPYIDDQLAEHFRQVINPELDDLSQRCRALQQQNERQQNEINELTQRVTTLENN